MHTRAHTHTQRSEIQSGAKGISDFQLLPEAQGPKLNASAH